MNALLFILLAVLFAVVIYGLVRMMQTVGTEEAPAHQPCGCGGCGRCPCCSVRA